MIDLPYASSWTLGTVLALLLTVVAATATTAQPSKPSGSAGQPEFETYGALPWEKPAGAVPYLVEEVTDGDTIRVIAPVDAGDLDPGWEPVRMVGIDAPEKDGPYTDEECYGQEATEFLKELLPEGTIVYLQVDNDEDIPDELELNNEGIELEDNDRWLVHVYLRADGTDEYYLVSEILALGGLVDVKDYGDNSYFAGELQDAEELARGEDRGIWGACAA